MSNRRIVCAACISDNGVMVIGPRHWDPVMHDLNRFIGINAHTAKQGFIDQRGAFMDRKEAYAVAVCAAQIRHKTGNTNSRELYSEDIY